MLSNDFKIKIKSDLEQLNEIEDQKLWKAFIGDDLFESNLDLQDRNLFWYNIQDSIKSYNDKNTFLKYISLISDVFYRESLRDKLTLLYKRNILWEKGADFFFDSLSYNKDASYIQFLNEAETQKQKLTFIYFDLDYFKAYNDLFSYLGGDLLLKRVSYLLLKEYDKKDSLVFRMGGEEFVLIVKNIQDIDAYAKNLHKELKEIIDNYFIEIAQLYNENFSREEAYDFIRDEMENYILLNRSLEFDSEFVNIDLQAIKSKLYFYQSIIMEIEDLEEIKRYENKIQNLERKIYEMENKKEKLDKEKLYFLELEKFQRILVNYKNKHFIYEHFDDKDFSNLSPSEFLKVLKYIKNFDFDFFQNEQLFKIYENLSISVAGTTMAILDFEVDLEDRFIEVDENILAEVENFYYGIKNKYDENIDDQIQNIFLNKNLNYNELYFALSKYLLKEDYLSAISIINRRRVDKIVQIVSNLEEMQKHKKRNSILIKKEHYRSEDILLSYSRKKINENILNKYYELKEKTKFLFQYYQKQLQLFKNYPVNEWWFKIEEKIKELDNLDFRLLSENYEKWISAFKYRFFDALLSVYNNQYLLDFENYILDEYKLRKKNYTIVALDFDNLKSINESISHYSGDIVLMETVIYLNIAFYNWAKANNLDEKDYPRIVRATPGEEFVLLFPSVNEYLVKDLLDNITIKITEKIVNWLKDSALYNKVANYLYKNNPNLKNDFKIASFTSTILNIKDYYNDENFSFQYLYQLLSLKNSENKEKYAKAQNYLFKKL